jgi:NAD dependent epimerase/dehydratase family enzyme
MDQESFTALIYGSTGAVGRELVAHLLNSPKWRKVIVIVRNPLAEWETHPKKSKLQV